MLLKWSSSREINTYYVRHYENLSQRQVSLHSFHGAILKYYFQNVHVLASANQDISLSEENRTGLSHSQEKLSIDGHSIKRTRCKRQTRNRKETDRQIKWGPRPEMFIKLFIIFLIMLLKQILNLFQYWIVFKGLS